MKAVSLIGLLLIATVSQAATSPGSSQDYKQVQQVMKQLAADHPNNASVFELGTNDQGVKLLGLKLGNGAVKNLIVGTHHRRCEQRLPRTLRNRGSLPFEKHARAR
jgi:hypothetical protein